MILANDLRGSLALVQGAALFGILGMAGGPWRKWPRHPPSLRVLSLLAGAWTVARGLSYFGVESTDKSEWLGVASWTFNSAWFVRYLAFLFTRFTDDRHGG